ncbi:hypothetical protein [Bacillus pacificus]|uniref:O-antigen ligase family protein n=1 Tax=Bacillus pacificus TaxID=2026187 RepID=UPI002E241582|nr:hypothetical protein [Bacillus pacificus]
MKRNISLWSVPWYFLFFLMLFAPVSYKPLKIALIITVLVVVLLTVIRRKDKIIPLNKQVFWLTLFFTSLGAFFTLLGLFKGTPGALTVATVHIFWPWLYLFFIIGMNNKNTINQTLNVMVIATIAIELYSLSYVFYSKGMLPSYLYLDLNLRKNVGFHDGYVEVSLDSTGSLVFLLPFILSAICLWKEDQRININRKLLWASFILGCIYLLLSGRRALLITTAFSPVILLFFAFFYQKKIRMRIYRSLRWLAVITVFVSVIGFSYLKTTMGYDLSLFKEMISSAFDFNDSSNVSAHVRETQFVALLDGWSQNPLFGNGFGAVASVIRNEEAPWSYELQYFDYLFHTGIVGVFSYGFGIFWIIFQGIKMIKSKTKVGILITPLLVGMISFLIANSSNPYLNKYDFLWTIFLPIGFINYYLTNKTIINSEELKEEHNEKVIPKKRKFKKYKITW